jgi:hypothetical protein
VFSGHIRLAMRVRGGWWCDCYSLVAVCARENAPETRGCRSTAAARRALTPDWAGGCPRKFALCTGASGIVLRGENGRRNRRRVCAWVVGREGDRMRAGCWWW